jgi:hypothetical protein
MTGRNRHSSDSSLLTPELVGLIAISSVELATKNAAALHTWGIGTSDRWSADLAQGSINFHFADHTITGPIQVLGTWSSESDTWLWAWANDALPQSVTEAASTTREYGRVHELEALTEAKLGATTAELSEDLASVVVELADLAGMYRAPTQNGFIWLGFTDFQNDG